MIMVSAHSNKTLRQPAAAIEFQDLVASIFMLMGDPEPLHKEPGFASGEIVQKGH